MFNKIIDMFDFSQKALNLYAKRQEILSSNIANVDTPGYKAIDINFKNELNAMLKNNTNHSSHINLKTTSPNHFLNSKSYKQYLVLKTIPRFTNQIKKDENTVNIDQERVEFVNNSLQYESRLIFLKNEIKNMIHVIQG